MDTKTILATLTRAMLASIAGALVHHGVIQSSGTEAFIGAGMLAATGAWGLWNGYGKDIAKAAGDILRAKVMNAAARAQETPALAPQALASLAAHVEATTPAAAPASPPVASVAILAIALSTLALAWAGPAGAQGVPRLTGNPVKDFAPPPKAAAASTGIASPAYDSIGGELQKVLKDVIDHAITDLTAASTDAKSTNDLISQPCWDAQVSFLKLLPAEWPTPPTDVGPALAIQIGRDLRRALTSDQPGSLKVACAALFGDELQQVGKLFSILGLRTAGLAIGLPL